MENTYRKTKLSSLSIILPAYNEAANIYSAIKAADDIAKEVAQDYEIIVVNDGSTDDTGVILDALTIHFDKLRPVHQKNKGYGGAITTGFKNAEKEWIFFTDSDLQFDLRELKEFIPYTENHDYVLGHRQERADSKKRKLLQNLLKVWAWVFFGVPFWIKDIDCAFKLMRATEFKSLMPFYSEGGIISSEFVSKIVKSTKKIVQLPVSHYPRKHGSQTGADMKVVKKAITETFVYMHNTGVILIKRFFKA